MRHVFILNPAAGKKKEALQVPQRVSGFFEAHPAEHAFFVTGCAGEATDIARRESAKGDAVRLYACGGDGTVLEVLNGMAGADNAELACVPCGSGNDFLRGVAPNGAWDWAALMGGTARRVDAIRCNGSLSLNMCSMGMDANVADRMVHYKRLPLVSGSMAYNLAIVRTFFGKLGQPLRVTMDTDDGPVERAGEYLFALAANGPYYGGGYCGSPASKPDDGRLEFVLIKDIRHTEVLRFLKIYKAGGHLSLPCCEMFRGRRMRVCAETPAVVTADGECFRTTDVTFELVPQAVSFVFPAAPADELLKNCENSEIFPIST